MKVCITTISTTNKFTGIAFYLQKLIYHLQEIDSNNEYIIITTTDNRNFFEIKNKNFKEFVLPLNQDSFISRVMIHMFNIFFFPLFILFHKIDLVHYPNTMFINRFFSKTVITIHDIVEQKVNKYGRLRNFYRKFMVKRALKYSNAVITVSNNSSKDLSEVYPRKIEMIYNGYESCFRKKRINEKAVLEKYNVIPQKYFIVIGTLLKHKNIPRLVKVFAQWQTHSKNGLDTLLIIGHKENDYENIIKEIKLHVIEDKIKVLDYVNNDEKETLLKNAFAFLFFSLYEGFGFPILEAQDLEVPVIMLDTSCLKEIAGEHAIAIPNSSNDSDLVDGLNEHVTNLLDLNYRRTLVSESKKNMKRFDWNDCANKTLSLYEKYGN